MAQAASERVVNGIKTRVLHGKDYVEVHERVRMIQHDEGAQGFDTVSQERYELNGRFFFSVTIIVKGKRYTGDAEITFDAPRNTPAGSSPMETAQTSALGRALAFAGYGTVESIASWDEIARHQSGMLVIEGAGRPTVEGSVSIDELAPITATQLESLRQLHELLERPIPDTIPSLDKEAAKALIQQLRTEWQQKQRDLKASTGR